MAATEKKMTRKEMGEFLREPSIARIATINHDGSPHVTPIWFMYTNGIITFSIGKNTMKARNLSRDNRVSLCVDESEHPNRTVLVQGRAIPMSETTAEYILKAAVHYLGKERGNEYTRAMAGFPSTTYRVDPTKIITWYYLRQ